MDVCLLFNPKAGSAGQMDALRQRLAADHRLTVIETASGEDLRRQVVAAATQKRLRVIAVAGGDGTVHAVVNALAPNFPRTRLAIIPLGTGNDLCRTLDVPLDPLASLDLLKTGRRRKIDVARVEGDWAGHMVNAATGGFSGQVARDVTAEAKRTWGPLAYLSGAAVPIAERATYRVTFRFDDGPPRETEVLNLVVANARTAAGGVVVAPTANPEDGRLDVVIVRPADVLDLSAVTARLMAGDYTEDELVSHRSARKVEIVADPPIPISIDGELTEGRRFVFTAVPRALRVLTGPGYRPDPKGRPVGPGGLRPWAFAVLAGLLNALRYTPRAAWAGLAAATVLAAAFWWLAFMMFRDGRPPDDEVLLRQVEHARSEALDPVAIGVTQLGSIPATLLIGGVAAWILVRRGRRLDAALLGIVLLGCFGLELVMKPIFALARPELDGALVFARWHSFPSGHALRAAGLGGYLAALLLMGVWSPGRWVLALVCVIMAIAISASRVYVGVHFPTDVIAGMLAAASWVVLVLSVRHAIIRYQVRTGV